MGLFKKISRFIGFGGSSQNRNKEIKALTVEKSKPLAKQVASPAVKIVAPKLKPKLAKRNPSKRTPSKRTPSKRTTPSKSNNTNTEEDNAHTPKFISANFGVGSFTYKTVTFANAKMGMVINCRRPHCVVVTSCVPSSHAESLGVETGDIVISINNEKPARWLQGVSTQLISAKRPCVVEFVRFGKNKRTGASNSKEVSNALMPWRPSENEFGERAPPTPSKASNFPSDDMDVETPMKEEYNTPKKTNNTRTPTGTKNKSAAKAKPKSVKNSAVKKSVVKKGNQKPSQRSAKKAKRPSRK